MLTLGRSARKTGACLCPIFFVSIPRYYNSSFAASPVPSQSVYDLQVKDVVQSFREWFKSRHSNTSNSLLDRIFEILNCADVMEENLSRTKADLALSKLNLRLNERLVLDVLSYGKDVLPCLKFFDWAGRQPGFYHTQATFHAIFKILSKAKLTSLMINFLESFMKARGVHMVRFYDTLVMGYAIAGKPEIALQLFGKMRFQGIDLGRFAYHVLLNALVEQSCFDVFDMVAKQIKLRGFENEVTHSLLVKGFCKRKELDRAETYTRGLVRSGVRLRGRVIGVLVDGFCKDNQIEKAGMLVEEFRKLGMVPMENAYSVWSRYLVQSGRLDGALEFVQGSKGMDDHVPDVFRYNTLLCKLLRENRIEDVCDLLMEMKEMEVCPDEVSMNSALCFFCKAGMVEVALDLFNSRVEFGFLPSSMAYNYLINTLCRDGSIDEAYQILSNSIDQGYFPGRRTFSILADALYREGKVDTVKELVLLALKRDFMLSDSTYEKLICALCRSKRVEDGYLVHGQLSRLNKVSSRYTYFNLIDGFIKSNRGDIAVTLLVEMQEKGHIPSKRVFCSVIGSFFVTENPEIQFLRLLNMQLSSRGPTCEVYKFFIDGAGHVGRPDLARKVYDMMSSNGIVPSLSSDIAMLQSYLKSGKFSDALKFCDDLSNRRKFGRKLSNTMVVGLCKANKPYLAFSIFEQIREKKQRLSLECYEELVKLLCSHKKYDVVVSLMDDLIKNGRPISSFIGNVLLLHSIETPYFYHSWVGSIKNMQIARAENPSIWALGELIGAFSADIREDRDIEDLEEVIGQNFPLHIYTYNLLLRKLINSGMDNDEACKFFNRLCRKGYPPNRWTYNILINGFYKHGRKYEAAIWEEKMFQRGFDWIKPRVPNY